MRPDDFPPLGPTIVPPMHYVLRYIGGPYDGDTFGTGPLLPALVAFDGHVYEREPDTLNLIYQGQS